MPHVPHVFLQKWAGLDPGRWHTDCCCAVVFVLNFAQELADPYVSLLSSHAFVGAFVGTVWLLIGFSVPGPPVLEQHAAASLHLQNGPRV